ncbi:MAG: DUF2442 domain-containing protein [Oscillospiraceae bacterium]|jgi:hypothetical protein|nr:DUF2442 domain-containing protein [Oscillospiraceae bacterium]
MKTRYDPVLDDEIVIATPQWPRVTAVQPLPDYVLQLEFNNGERRLFDAKPLLKEKVYARLNSVTFFNLVRASFGTVEWPCNIDYSPDSLYIQSVPG